MEDKMINVHLEGFMWKVKQLSSTKKQFTWKVKQLSTTKK